MLTGGPCTVPPTSKDELAGEAFFFGVLIWLLNYVSAHTVDALLN
jgi:hypothetical protein